MKRALAVLALVLANAPSPALAGGTRPADTAAALDRDPVYVAPVRSSRLDASAQGRLRLRIVDKNIGRIKIAVIPGAWAREEGGVRAYANAVDADLRGRGALLVYADGNVHVVTSHRYADDAASGAKRAFSAGGGLENELRRAVDALAEVDPGPSGDARGPEPGSPATSVPGGFPDPDKIVDSIDQGIKATFIVVLAIVVAIFSLVAFLTLRGLHRAREESEESLEDARAAAEAERVALGEDIVDLDAVTSMPDVAASARSAYERALDAYEKSGLALQRADSGRRLAVAAALIAKGREDAASARRVTG